MVNANETVTYTPNAAIFNALNVGQQLTDSFVYDLITPQGTSNTATAIVHINGIGVPEISFSASQLNFGTVTDGNATSLQETVTNSGTGTLVISGVNNVGLGFSTNFTPVSLTQGQSETFNVTLDPSAGSLGAYPALNLTFSDNAGNVSGSSQSVALTAASYTPIATGGEQNISLDSASQQFNISSLVNADPNGDVITFTTPTGANFTTAQGFSGTISAAGVVTINTTGPNAAEYNAAVGSSLNDSFNYEVTDAYGNVSTNSVQLSELVVAESLVAVADTVTTPVTSPLNINVLANDTLPNDLPIGVHPTVNIVTAPTFGSVVVNADGSVTYTANGQLADALALGQNLVDTFQYDLVTPQGTSNVVTDQVTLTGSMAALSSAGTMSNDILGANERTFLNNTNLITSTLLSGIFADAAASTSALLNYQFSLVNTGAQATSGINIVDTGNTAIVDPTQLFEANVLSLTQTPDIANFMFAGNSYNLFNGPIATDSSGNIVISALPGNAIVVGGNLTGNTAGDSGSLSRPGIPVKRYP